MQIAISEKDYDPKLTPIYLKFVSRIKMNIIVSLRLRVRNKRREKRENKRKRYTKLKISCRYEIRFWSVMFGLAKNEMFLYCESAN